jgi:hypothetical protein
MDDMCNPASEQPADNGDALERERIEELIRLRIAASTGAPAAPGCSPRESGLDSLGAVDLKSHLETLGADIPLSIFFSGRSIAEIARQVQAASGDPRPDAPVRDRERHPDQKDYEEGTL